MPDYNPSYSQWWEAFAGGEFEGGDAFGELAPGQDYQNRTQAFYSQVVGPSFGFVPDPDTGELFGNIFNEYVASFDVEAMEQAEETFKMSIGDPYGAADFTDPYSWERISRMSPEEAQAQLGGTLYGAGEYLGGTTGATYGTSMAAGEEAYTSGLTAQREGLTYGGLTGSQSLISGTSGAVLRSGEGIMQAEDVLAEAYKKAKDLGAGYMETQETTQMSLEENLNDALTIYLDAVDSEKEGWFNNVMSQVQTASQTWGADFGGEAAEFEEWQEQWEEGLTYEEAPWDETAIEMWQELNESGACGIGEVVDPETGLCALLEDLDLEYDQFGLPCPTGVDECGECGGDGSSCIEPDDDEGEGEEDIEGCMDPDGLNYDPNATSQGLCDYEEEEGIISGCTDPMAENYNPYATEDDGGCELDEGEGWWPGCTDQAALNYNPSANEDDGSCEYEVPIDNCGNQCLPEQQCIFGSGGWHCVSYFDEWGAGG